MKHRYNPLIGTHGGIQTAVIGAGGSGSQVLTGLARLDRALRALHGDGLHVTVFDPDVVTPVNVGRQLFSPADIGLNKAAVLVHRLNMFFGLDWEARPAEFTGQVRQSDLGLGVSPIGFLITCVDSARARRQIVEGVTSNGLGRAPRYWLDLGNSQQDGQVVLGEFWKQVDQARLPHVADLFPELMDAGFVEDARPSCSLAEALQSQDLMINQAMATWGLHLLWRLLRDREIEHHGYYINLAEGRVSPIPVPDEALR